MMLPVTQDVLDALAALMAAVECHEESIDLLDLEGAIEMREHVTASAVQLHTAMIAADLHPWS